MTATQAFNVLVARYPLHHDKLTAEAPKGQFLMEITALPEMHRHAVIKQVIDDPRYIDFPPNPGAIGAAMRARRVAAPEKQECPNPLCANGWVPSTEDRKSPSKRCPDCGVTKP